MAVALGPDTMLPLIDGAAMANWCEDLDREDIEAILSQVPGQCDICLSEIEAAVAANDLAKTKRVAHRLKGMAANLGAARLARFARSIEIEVQELKEVEGQLPALNATVAETLSALQAMS